MLFFKKKVDYCGFPSVFAFCCSFHYLRARFFVLKDQKLLLPVTSFFTFVFHLCYSPQGLFSRLGPQNQHNLHSAHLVWHMEDHGGSIVMSWSPLLRQSKRSTRLNIYDYLDPLITNGPPSLHWSSCIIFFSSLFHWSFLYFIQQSQTNHWYTNNFQKSHGIDYSLYIIAK